MSTAPAVIRTASRSPIFRTPPTSSTPAYASDVGVDNDPIDADGGYVWYAVADIAKAHERTLEEVKAQVTQRWRDDEIAARLKAKAEDMLGKLKGGEAFDASPRPTSSSSKPRPTSSAAAPAAPSRHA